MNPFSRRALLSACSAALLPAGLAGAAVMTIDTVAPSGAGVVIANPHSPYSGTAPDIGPLGERDTFTTAFPTGGGYGSRGQSFLMPDNPVGSAWDLTALTIRADATANGTGFAQDLSVNGPSTLKMWLFEWNPSTNATTATNWTAGDGSSDGDPFDGTGIANFLINGQVFDVTRSFSGEFLHFATPGIQLQDNTAYGVLFTFESGGTAGFRIDEVRDGVAPNGQSYPSGGLLRSDATAHTYGQSGDDLVFYVEATIPEPTGVAALGMAGLALLRRRQAR
jgi:hypothetical protein